MYLTLTVVIRQTDLDIVDELIRNGTVKLFKMRILLDQGFLTLGIGKIPEKSPYQFIQLQNYYSVNTISGTDFGAGLFYPLWFCNKNLLNMKGTLPYG